MSDGKQLKRLEITEFDDQYNDFLAKASNIPLVELVKSPEMKFFIQSLINHAFNEDYDRGYNACIDDSLEYHDN